MPFTGMFTAAPFSDKQVKALNHWQARGDVHAFTCPNDHGDKTRVLIATKNGWVCRNCAYTQNWCHDMMLRD